MSFEQRAARAAALAEGSAAAREPLLFAALLCRAQGSVAEELARAHSIRPLTGRLADDIDRLLPLCGDLLRVVRERLQDEPRELRDRLLAYWNAGGREDYLARAVLRPYVEFLRVPHIAPDRMHAPGHCPFCGGAPVIGSRSEATGVDGQVRRLHCGLCGNDWIFKRACCPACLEDEAEKLPIYQTEAHAAARVEACDTCRSYLKSVDRSLDPEQIPEIDDLASIALDLWAVEEGYTRIEPGLAGL